MRWLRPQRSQNYSKTLKWEEKRGGPKKLLKSFLLAYLSKHLMVNLLPSLEKTSTLHFSRIILKSGINIHHSERHLLEVPKALDHALPSCSTTLLFPESTFSDQLREHGNATLTKIFHDLWVTFLWDLEMESFNCRSGSGWLYRCSLKDKADEWHLNPVSLILQAELEALQKGNPEWFTMPASARSHII